jgi:DHA1 family bicyclomycin/chloramphenicol resistance-like MFS transporter
LTAALAKEGRSPPPSEKAFELDIMQIQPTSVSFTLLLGFLAALPYSGIDINLPALAATGATLGANPSDVGLTMSAFMFSLAAAPLVYGPTSDRIGRKPVVVCGVALFVLASLARTVAQSLPTLKPTSIVQRPLCS